MRAIVSCGILLTLTLQASAGHITFIDEANGDYRIASVTGVTFEGVTYDVSFSHELSYEGFVAAISPVDPMPFESEEAVSGVVAALGSVLASHPVDFPEDFSDSGSEYQSTAYILVPFHVSTTANGDRVAYGVNFFSINYGAPPELIFAQGETFFYDVVTTEILNDDGAWASFTPVAAVPEPGSITLFGLGALLLGGAGVTRRRRNTPAIR